MPADPAFAPYRLAPGALPEEAARAAADAAAAPLVAPAGEPLPGPLVNRALADVPAGRAAAPAEACRAADGSPAGGAGPARACLSSERHRARVAEAARAALEAGFAGICLDRPDAPLALGLLGAGFCSECQRDLARHLEREYGDHFQPVDYLALARGAVAQASGAVSFERLPFGRDFWRVRHDALPRAVAAYARAARDLARAARRPFQVVAQLEAVGPAQLRACRHLDAAIFPAQLAPGATGVGLARLLRAALGRRPCALAPPAGAAPAALARLGAVAASCGLELSGVEPSGPAGRDLARVRHLARRLAAHALSPTAGDPLVECAVLYSAHADLWSGGRHRAAVERAGEVLAARGIQAPVVLRPDDAPSVLVVPDAAGLSGDEAKQLRRRLEAGGALLAFGEPTSVDEAGRPEGPFLPASRPNGLRAREGTLAALPPLVADGRGAEGPDPALLERALLAVLGRGRRAVSVEARAPVLAVVHRVPGALVVHLAATEEAGTQGALLSLGAHVAGGVRRGRFVSADGVDARLSFVPSGQGILAALPRFEGYAVVSVAV